MPALGPDDPRLGLCGFARLYGDAGKVDVTLRKYEASLGRPSKGKDVDVPLDGHKAVSREHATIRYNFDTKRWELEVLGKNGVRVNGVHHLPGGDRVPLPSQSLLQIGEELTFYFLLPKKPELVATAGRKRRPPPLPAHLVGVLTAPPPLKRQATINSRPHAKLAAPAAPAAPALPPTKTTPSAARVAPPPDVLQMFSQQPVAAAVPAAAAVPVPAAAAAKAAPKAAAVSVPASAVAPVAVQAVAAQAQQALLAQLMQNPAALQQMLAASMQQQGGGVPGAVPPGQLGLPPAALAALQQQQAAAAAAVAAAQPAVLQQKAAAPSADATVATLAAMPPQQRQAVLAAMPEAQRQAAVAMLAHAQQQQLLQAQRMGGGAPPRQP